MRRVTNARIRAMLIRRYLLLSLLCCVVARATETVGEVEITAEPHHHHALQNAYIRAFRLELGPSQSTLTHRHRHDYLFVTIGSSQVSNEVVGKPPVVLNLRDGEVRFVPG